MTDSSHRFSELVAQVAAAYFTHSHVSVADIPTVMRNIAAGLTSGEDSAPPSREEAAMEVTSREIAPARRGRPPAAPAAAANGQRTLTSAQIRNSIRPEALISFEDGRPYKILKRHLSLRGLNPDQYREKWGLGKDYPMTAANYSAVRSAVAKKVGLGGRFGAPRRGRRTTRKS